MLERTVHRVPLRRTQLVEVPVDALLGLELCLAVRPTHVAHNLFSG